MVIFGRPLPGATVFDSRIIESPGSGTKTLMTLFAKLTGTSVRPLELKMEKKVPVEPTRAVSSSNAPPLLKTVPNLISQPALRVELGGSTVESSVGSQPAAATQESGVPPFYP